MLLDPPGNQASIAKRDLLEYIPWRTPHYKKPVHLKQFTDLLQRACRGESIKAVVHAPPRFAKTESILHMPAWAWWNTDPNLNFGYASYNVSIANSKSKIARNIARRQGYEFDSELIKDWRIKDGGGFIATGINGELTGKGFKIGVIDDAVKNRLEAESALKRQTAVEFLESTFLPRLEPGGSVFINMTRWHPDDLAGHCIKNLGWPYIRIPAIDEFGNSTWPERWPTESLLEKKQTSGVYTWSSLYQGEPRPRGGSVFQDPWGYKLLPVQQTQFAIGVDMAYSTKSSADYSVIVVMAKCRDYYYIADVVRAQVQPPQFAELLRQYKMKYPAARMRWYASGTEKAAAAFIRELKDPSFPNRPYIPLDAIPPRGDKFTRAIAYAAAWNAGRVLIPDSPDSLSTDTPWLNDFLTEHATFTGVNDDHDDQVDAAVAAFDVLQSSTSDWGDSEIAFPRRM